jgi:hypothetical protein
MARRPTPEKEHQARIQGWLHEAAYVVDHSYALPTTDGSWRTGSTWVGKPDLIAVRPPRVVVIEVKAKGGTASEQQIASLSLWSLVPCARAWLLPPGVVSDELVQAWIRRPGTAPAAFGFTPMTHEEALKVLATSAQRKGKPRPGGRRRPGPR